MAAVEESKSVVSGAGSESVVDTVTTSRSIAQAITPREQPEGKGATVRRAIGTHKLPNLDPFLMLDYFTVGKPAGFPDHPHRGFETVTYMLEGAVQHEDFVGHKGIIGAGDVQWMTAGRGIVHAEMPAGKARSAGLQLWVNLFAVDKMCKPSYQDMMSDKIPVAKGEGVTAKIIAGSAFGTTARTVTRTPMMYIDFRLEGGATLNQAIPAGWNGFIYTLEGRARVGKGSTQYEAHQMLVMSNDGSEDGITIVAGKSGCRLVLVAGKPIKEPVVQHGPFVMNTKKEIMQAIMDYQNGVHGFERARRFRSTIATGKDLPGAPE